MKIFLLVFFAFTFIRFRKAQTTEDEYDSGIFESETDESTPDCPEELSVTFDSRRDSGAFLSHMPKKRDHKEKSTVKTLQQPLDSADCVCGLENETEDKNKIVVNGSKVEPPYKYPWMVALQKNGRTFCGGSLITDQHILTAAHCLADPDAGEAAGRASSARLKFFQPHEVRVMLLTRTEKVVPSPPIMEITPHPAYNFNTNNNDIAVVKLSRKITCNKFRRPICLPRPGTDVNLGKVFITAGWGATEIRVAADTGILMEAKIERVPYKHCKKYWNIQENFYCLKGLENSTPCKGDSGGPMFSKVQRRSHIFGIASMHVSSKCDPKKAFIYTKVPKYIKWITSVIQ